MILLFSYIFRLISAKDPQKIPPLAKNNLFSSITAGEIAQKALHSYISKIEKHPESVHSDLVKQLNLHKRQSGLRQFDNDALYSIAFLQKHCSVIEDDTYKSVKVLIENNLPEREM